MSDFYRSQGFRDDAADHLRLAAQVRLSARECRDGFIQCHTYKGRGPEIYRACVSQGRNEAAAAAANHSDLPWDPVHCVALSAKCDSIRAGYCRVCQVATVQASSPRQQLCARSPLDANSSRAAAPSRRRLRRRRKRGMGRCRCPRPPRSTTTTPSCSWSWAGPARRETSRANPPVPCSDAACCPAAGRLCGSTERAPCAQRGSSKPNASLCVLRACQACHPPAHIDICVIPTPISFQHVSVSSQAVAVARRFADMMQARCGPMSNWTTHAQGVLARALAADKQFVSPPHSIDTAVHPATSSV